METVDVSMNKVVYAPFKSYYVVWKLAYKDNYSLSENTFKSYYVVWKLFSKTRKNTR